MKEEVFKILKSKEPKLCVIATSDGSGKTESATMGYTILENLTVLLSTSSNSRKWKNLKENDQVSLVFGFTFEEVNIQYEGQAKTIDGNNSEYSSCEEAYFTDHPESIEYKNQNGTVFIKVTPHWIRTSDYSEKPERVEEIGL